MDRSGILQAMMAGSKVLTTEVPMLQALLSGSRQSCKLQGIQVLELVLRGSCMAGL